ncbi:Ig-like domain-containing protein [Dokdonella sp.]|uniref:Ig-like domain-containing protein n=1 Tax=Dokdonella sp. TaxID=2291710 RepID=UPI001B1C4BC5|nr:Ig-like domain-containing protein [Dokdonella sp.]MBO9662123.1 Ig-like domain-containing protein [Dokdonella sp.]
MQARLITTAVVAALSLASFAPREAQAYDYYAPVQFHTVASFDPSQGVIPFPNNLLLSGTKDLTLNIPVADPNAPSAGPTLAMNALDGFSTTAPWSTSFSAPIDPASLTGGSSVRVFQVRLSGPGGGVVGIERELASPAEFVVAPAPSDASGRTIAIVPTKPLQQMTSYMAVLTDGIKDAAGHNVRGSLVYQLAKRTSPLCANNASLVTPLPAATACALEPLRLLVNTQEAAAATAGVNPAGIAMSWVMTTQNVTAPLLARQSVIEQSPPAATRIAPTGKTLGDLGLGLPPVADIYIGTVDLPYYLNSPDIACVPEGPNCPTNPLVGNWEAAPGAYLPPFDKAGLDPTSTNVTYANPLAVAKTTQVAPLLMTVPNASSGKTKPAAGWPLVIFQHGITRNRTDMFAVAGTLAAQGFAVVAIDLPLHGITDKTNPFYIGNTPLAALGARERTFDLDLVDNATGAPGPDGVIDGSGSHYINLTSLLTSRDNLREGVVDLLELSHAVQGMHYSTGTDFDTAKVSFLGQSLGSIVGATFLAIDPNVQTGMLSVPGGGIARLLDASPTFGPRIHAGLAAAGIEQGTPLYDTFMAATQTVVDSGDPINFAGNGTLLLARYNEDGSVAQYGKNLLVHEVVGGGDVLPDQVIPNRVAGAPLSGTEPLIAALQLPPITESVQSTGGSLQGAVRFVQGEHGSLLDPTDFPAATQEMQGEMASFLATGGQAVLVRNPAVILGPQP